MDPGFLRFRGLSLGWYMGGLATANGTTNARRYMSHSNGSV